jgi:DNA-binding response OmpR family regulator
MKIVRNLRLKTLKSMALVNREHLQKKSKTILLVDDDRSVRELISRVLEGEGYHVITSVNGKQALDKAETQPVDLVLLDLNMPEKNGWDTFETLTFKHPRVPVVIITARSNQLFTALNAGAAALMEKPLDFPKLLGTINDLLAEPAEAQQARIAGKAAAFHYQPSGAGG